MKMKVIDRILLALYGFLGALLLAAAGVCRIWPQVGEELGGLLDSYTAEVWFQVVVWVLLAVLLAWSVQMIVLAFRHEPRKERGSVSVQNAGDGAVRISVSAMDTLVRQAIGQVDGVVGIKTRIVNHEDSITVNIDMALTSDARIPNITMLMQRNIKRFIEEFSGIAVREVVILVSEIQAVEAPVPPVLDDSVKPVLVEPEKVENEIRPEAERTPAEPFRQEDPAPQEAEEPDEEPPRAEEEAAVEREPVQEDEAREETEV